MLNPITPEIEQSLEDTRPPVEAVRRRDRMTDEACTFLRLHTSVEAMAAYYAAAMLSVHSDGPFLIGGWSLGVILAYATATELERRGARVALLALLDQGPEVPGDEPVDTAAYLESVFGGHIPFTAICSK